MTRRRVVDPLASFRDSIVSRNLDPTLTTQGSAHTDFVQQLARVRAGEHAPIRDVNIGIIHSGRDVQLRDR